MHAYIRIKRDVQKQTSEIACLVLWLTVKMHRYFFVCILMWKVIMPVIMFNWLYISHFLTNHSMCVSGVLFSKPVFSKSISTTVASVSRFYRFYNFGMELLPNIILVSLESPLKTR